MTVFLCILGALLLLLCIPIWVRVSWEKELRLTGGWLFLKVPLLGPDKPPKKEKKPETAKKKLEQVPQEHAKPALRDLLNLILDGVRSAKGGMRMILRDLRVRDLRLRVTVAAADAADTAVQYGRMQAYVGAALATLQNFLRFRRMREISIRPDFGSDHGDFTVSFSIHLTPLVALAAVIRMGCSFLFRFLKRQIATPKEKPAPKAEKSAPELAQNG